MGDCEAEYEQIEESYKEITLKKTKNLMKCRNHFTSSLAHTYESLIGLGRNMQTCHYKISTRNPIIQSVLCKQEYDAKYNHVSTLQMQLIEQRAASSDYQQDITGYKRSSLLFVPQTPEEVDGQQLKSMFEALCASTSDLIQPFAPQQFRKFVQALDGTQYESLKALWQSVESQSINCDAKRVKKLFVQAITYSRSGAALKMAHEELYKRNIMSEDRLKAMVHSLIFKNHINTETIEALVSLLRSNLVMKQSLFGLTSAIQRYVDAGHDRSLALVAVKLIADKIDADDELTATIYVRALGNVRVWDEEILSKLIKLAKSSDPELAIAAIDTLGKYQPCGQIHELFYSFITGSGPIEVRVAAFKAYARCVQADELTKIVRSISSSSDSNFYGYVQSFLYNNYNTMDPDYQALKIEIDRAESIDFKPEQFYHSRHWSFSRMTPNSLTGINLEADVVVESSKKVPTWFIFNASIPIHRHNIHGFEIGIRQEGLDEVAMKMMEKIKRTNWQYAMDEVKRRQNFQPFADELSKIQQEFVTKFQRNAKLSFYVELNQQTLFYFNGLKSVNQRTFRDPIISLIENVQGLNTVVALSFSNYETSNPLMTGFEVHYWHVGSIVAGLKLESEYSSKRSLYPNIAGDYVMARDLVLRRPISGQVYNLTLSSNAYLRYAVAFQKNKYFNLDLELPAEEMDLFRIQDQHYHFKQNGAIVHENIHTYMDDRCSQTRAIGVQLCISHQMAHDKSVSWRLYLKKSDPSMTSLSFSLKREQENEIVLNVDTPGSSVPRNVEMRFKSLIGEKLSELKASLKSANYQLSGEAKIERSNNKIAIPITVAVNKKTHSLRFEMINEKPVSAKLRIVSPRMPEPIDYDVQFSKLTARAEEKFVKIFSNSKNGKRTQILMVRLQPENWRSLNDFKGSFQVEANCPKAGNVLTMTTTVSRSGEYPAKIDSKISYQRKGQKHQGSFNTAVRDLSTRDLNNYLINGQIECSEWKQKGAKFAHELMFNSERIANKLELAYGRNYKTGDDLMVHAIVQNTGLGKKLELKGTIEAKYNPNNFHHKAEISYRKSRSADANLDQLKVSHENVKNSAQNHEASLERSVRRSDVEVNGKWKCPRGEKSFILKLDRSEAKSYKTLVQYKDTKINSSPLYEAKGQLDLAPINTQIELVKMGQPLIKVRASYDKKQKTDVKMTAEMDIKNRQILKASAMRQNNKLEALFEEKIHGNTINLNAELDRQAVLDYKQNKQPVYQLIVKKSASAYGSLFEIKSLTKRGVKRVPDLLFEIDPKKFGFELDVLGEYYTWNSKAYINKSVPKGNFMVSFDCRKHRNVHKTEFNMDQSKIIVSSKHANAGEPVYELRMVHEKQIEGRQNTFELKTKNDFEINASHVYSPQEMKFNLTMNGQRDLDLSIKSVKNVAQGLGRRNLEEPRTTRVRVIYKSKVGEGAVFKSYAEHKASKSLRLTSVEYIRGDQREFLGSINIATDSPLYARMVSKTNTFDLEVDPWSPRKEVKYEYKTSNSQGSIKGNLQSVDDMRVRIQGALNLESKKRRDTKLSLDGEADVNIRNGLKGDIKLNWIPVKSSTPKKMQANIDLSNKIVKGPHSIVITHEKAEFKFNHGMASARNKNTLKTTLSVKDNNGQKLFDAVVDGDYDESNGKNVNLKTKIESAKYSSLQSVNHVLSISKKPREWSIVSKLNRNGKNTRITVQRDASSSTSKNLFTIDGFLQDGSSAQFTAKSECSENCAFNAKLLKNDQAHSELEVKVPLVKLTEFITKRASARFASPVFGTEAAFEIDAPATNNILVRAHATVDSKPLVAYRLQINDGANFKPYGADFKASGDSILFEHELKWKRNQVAEQKILVAQNAVAANLMVGPFRSVNTIIPGNKPRTLGQTCWTSTDRCAEYKLTLEKRSADGAKYDVVLKLSEKSAEKYKIHSQVDYDLKPENERLDVSSTFKDRTYGFGVERVSSSSKRLLKIKGVLPKRNPELHIEYQPFYGNELVGKVIFFHDMRKISEQMVTDFKINWENTSSKFLVNNLIKMSHNSIAEPFTVQAKISLDKARRNERSVFGFKSFDYTGKISHSEDRYLVGEANWVLKANEMGYKFNVYNQDKKINFGCVSNVERYGASRSLQAKRKTKCHWTDRDGQIKTYERDYTFDGELLRDGPKFSFSESLIHPLMAYKINGKIHVSDLLNLARIDLTIPNGPSYEAKVSVKNNCLYLNANSKANPKVYQLESCWNKRPRADEAYFTFNLTEQTTSESLVSFKIARMADFAHDKKVSLKWNTAAVADGMVSCLCLWASPGCR